MAISPDKRKQLQSRQRQLGIQEADIVEKFIHGQGRGGQKLNKTASCVHVYHIPSGITIKCQKSRSQSDNRFFARRELVDKIESIQIGCRSSKQLKDAKTRKQKKRRARRRNTES